MSVKQVSAQWWMPRHESAMKDVASCDKPRGAASEHRSGDFRMGKPGGGYTPSPEREEPKPVEVTLCRGCGALEDQIESVAERAWNGGPERVIVPYAKHE